MIRSISTILNVVVLFTQLNLSAFLPQVAAAPCGEPSRIYLPIVMAQPTILENLEEIMRADAAFPYDAVITQVFTNTVNVKPIGSRTIIRDVALTDGIKAEDLRPGYPVRLGHTVSKVTVEAYFEQFADPESVNYAGKGMKMPGKPTVSVKATAGGWVITWPAVPNATKYLVYTNNTPDGDAPELLADLPSSKLSYTATYNAIAEPFRYFAVQACNGLLEGDVSNWVTDETPPANPAWVGDTFQADGHHLKWQHSAPSDVEEFIIFRNTSASDVDAVEVGRTNKLELIAPYTSEGDWFGVQAVDYSGLNKSAIVWTSQAYDPTPAIPTPAANMAEIGGFVLTWPAVENVVRYEVQGATDDAGTGAATKWQGLALTTPTLAETGVAWFRIRAIGFDGSDAGWSSWVTDTNPPPQPNVITTADIRSVSISLAAADTSHLSVGFSHYVLERADGSGGQNATTLDDHATYASFPRVISQTTGVTKYFRLTPYDWAGNAGWPSAWMAATPSESGATVQDKFDRYGGYTAVQTDTLSFLLLSDFENDSWTINPSDPTPVTSYDTVNRVEGRRALQAVLGGSPGSYKMFYRNLTTGKYGVSGTDLAAGGRFDDEDFVMLAVHVTSKATLNYIIVEFRMPDAAGGHSYGYTWNASALVEGWNYLRVKKNQFLTNGTPTWADIAWIRLMAVGQSPTVVLFDDFRIVKADPDNTNNFNDTGAAWDQAVSSISQSFGQWHVYAGQRTAEPNKPFSYGQIEQAATQNKWYASFKPGVDIKAGTIQAGLFHKENGKSGLGFFVKNTGTNAWTMYAVEADNVTDTIALVKWENGTRTVLGTGSTGTFYSTGGGGTSAFPIWVGVDFTDYDTQNGLLRVYISATEGNIIQAGNLKLTAYDNSLGSGGTIALLSYQTNCRFINLVAGSPAHAEVADVAGAAHVLLGGETRRVHYNPETNIFEYTENGELFIPVDSVPPDLSNYLQKTSTNRPGVTKLYRRDNDSNYSVQTHWTGSHWWLRGYDGSDNFHAECRVDNLGGFAAADLKATGQVVQRTSDYSLAAATHTAIPFSSSLWNTANYWNGSTRLTAARTGWHMVYGMLNFDVTVNNNQFIIRILKGGSTILLQQNVRKPSDTGNAAQTLSGFVYLSSGEYVELWGFIQSGGFITTANFPGLFGLLSLEA
ncbi:MAG: hypothetical protein DPW09_32000 [Anaerolineae bacterium]|nr:hypothetical protein [Anaerolineales bacterium]MCQ3978073.1 hypothetical protein [Anaerolineae bacterium]